MHESAVRGSTVRFDCKVKSDPSLYFAVSWTKDDKPLHLGWMTRYNPERKEKKTVDAIV